MILMQASMYVFFIWMGILVINKVVDKITEKLDLNNETNKIIILPSDQKFEDVKQFSDEEFQAGFTNNTNNDDYINRNYYQK